MQRAGEGRTAGGAGGKATGPRAEKSGVTRDGVGAGTATASSGGGEGGQSVFVSNLPHDANEAQVRKLFGGDGGLIQRVKLLPAAGGETRGFVDFRTAEAAAAAIQLHDGDDHCGRRIAVAASRRGGVAKKSDRRSAGARERRKEAREASREPR